MASTPAMFMTTVDLGCDGAVQITASHHPSHRNGLKFFVPQGGLEGEDIEAILENAQEGRSCTAGQPGRTEKTDYMTAYAARAAPPHRGRRRRRGSAAEGLSSSGGCGQRRRGFYATQVLEPLGADISGSQFLEPDGHFPNHIPNPENEEAMASVCAAVKQHGADLGIIFDTDVDRPAWWGLTGGRSTATAWWLWPPLSRWKMNREVQWSPTQ